MINIDEFMKMEVDNELFNRSISNVKYWQLFRAELFLECMNIDNNARERHPDLQLSRSGKAMIYGGCKLLGSILQARQRTKCDFNNMISICTSRRETINSMELLLDYYKENAILIDIPYKYRYLPFDINVKRILTGYLDLKRGFKIKFFQHLPFGLKSTAKNEFQFLLPLLARNFYKLPQLEWMLNRIIHKIVSFNEVTEYFTKLWKKSRPKILVINDRTDTFSFAIISAAHQFGIPVVELMHGYVPYYDPCYNYPVYNFNYKESIVPDITLVYGDYWKQGIRGQKHEKIISCGSVELEHFRKIFCGEKKNYITFISQGPFSDIIYTFATKFADYLQRIHKQNEYEIIYKLHPNEVLTWNILHPNYKDSRIVLAGNELNVYQLMNESLAFIGINSTALFESIAFGVKVGVIISAFLTDDMTKFCHNGYATLINSEEDIYKLVLSECNEMEIENIWKSNALMNVVREIDNIIN